MTRHMLSRIGCLTCGLLTGCLAVPVEQGADAFAEPFDVEALDPVRWVVTRQHDFETATVDLVPEADGDGRRLRLRAATIGTDDRTVKFLGVRTRDAVVDLSRPTTVEVELDWNNQANGCYLTAGLYLCPTATDENPGDEADWLKVEYIGVPPGKNARCLVASKTTGGLRLLATEGWPTEQRTGRKIGRQTVTLSWDGKRLVVTESGDKLWEGPWRGFGGEPAYLYLQLSSHSNYPAREVFFDDVAVGPGSPG